MRKHLLREVLKLQSEVLCMENKNLRKGQKFDVALGQASMRQP